MKYNISKPIVIVVVFITQCISAQFYVGIQSGIANIQSDTKGTLSGNRPGGALKLGYIATLNHNFGMGFGIEFAHYKNVVSLENPSQTLSSSQVDQVGTAFIYNITTTNYYEKQTLNAVQLPVFFQYKKTINDGVEFNFRAGVKYFLPIDYKISASASSVSGTAYYPDVNLSISNLPEHGFGSQANYSTTGKYETKGILMNMFELGFTFDVGKKNSLYAAMFIENGSGTIIKRAKNESYIEFNPISVSDRNVNGLYSTDRDAKIKPVAFGLTMGWNFK